MSEDMGHLQGLCELKCQRLKDIDERLQREMAKKEILSDIVRQIQGEQSDAQSENTADIHLDASEDTAELEEDYLRIHQYISSGPYLPANSKSPHSFKPPHSLEYPKAEADMKRTVKVFSAWDQVKSVSSIDALEKTKERQRRTDIEQERREMREEILMAQHKHQVPIRRGQVGQVIMDQPKSTRPRSQLTRALQCLQRGRNKCDRTLKRVAQLRQT